MAFTASAKSSNYQLPPADSHVARLIRLIDLGTSYSDMYKKNIHQMAWAFELVNTQMEPNDEGKVFPFVIYEFLTRSMNEKAKLRGRVEMWRGSAFSNDEEAEQFPVDQLLGKPCLLTVIHGVKKNGEKKAEIVSIIKLPQGMEAKQPINEVFMFDLSEFDQKVFDKLPDGFKKNIQKSDEYIELMNPKKKEEAQTFDDFDDDIPF